MKTVQKNLSVYVNPFLNPFSEVIACGSLLVKSRTYIAEGESIYRGGRKGACKRKLPSSSTCEAVKVDVRSAKGAYINDI